MEGQGGKWDQGTWCEIPKESIQNYVIKNRSKVKSFFFKKKEKKIRENQKEKDYTSLECSNLLTRNNKQMGKGVD